MIVDVARLKQQAAQRAVNFVKSGMVVGLGHGSTALFAVRQIAQLLQDGRLRDIKGVPSIDGADEIDANMNLIKGGGGALLREKIVAQASRREIVVVDESKISPALGTRWPVPIEVFPFGWRPEAAYLETLGASPALRQSSDGALFQTDQGNYILDGHFGPISNPHQLAVKLNGRAGIVEHGLFLDLATDIIVAGTKGIRHLQRGAGDDRD